MSNDNNTHKDFKTRLKGRFVALRKWEDLDLFWEVLKQQSNGWFLYAPGELVPDEALDSQALVTVIDELDQLLRREHQESYCGIVYVDDRENPDFIKIYDPNNLGSACSASNAPPLPGWIFSRLPPEEIAQPSIVPAGRRRWWRSLFGSATG